MDSETINAIRQTAESTNDKDSAIELYINGQNSLLAELDPLILRLKRVNKDFCMDLLESHIEYLTDMLALTTKFLTKNSTASITPEQGLLIASLNSIIKDTYEEKKEEDIDSDIMKKSVQIKI